MAEKLNHPVVCIEVEVTEKNCPELKEILEQNQFQAKMDLVRWYERSQESDTPVGGKISVKIPR